MHPSLSALPARALTGAACTACLLTATATGQGFTEGDLYLMTADYPGAGIALVRIDPVDGSQTVLVTEADWISQGLVHGRLTTEVTYEATSDQLILTPTLPPRTLYFIDSTGAVQDSVNYGGIPGAGNVPSTYLTTDCNGRIYIYDGRYFAYINPDRTTGGQITTDGTTPLLVNTLGTFPNDFIYDETTHSLFVTQGGADSNIYKIPLSADGKQSAGPVEHAVYDLGYRGSTPKSLSRGPTHDENGNAYPNGTIFVSVDVNEDGRNGFQKFLFDPVTLAFFPYSQGDVNGAACTVGTFNTVHDYAVDFDTGFSNAIRIWDQYDTIVDGSAPTPTVLSAGVSTTFGSNEAAQLIAIGNTIGGFCAPPNIAPSIIGDPGPYLLDEDAPFQLIVSVDDPDGDTVTVTPSGFPAGMTATPLAGDGAFDIVIEWTPTAGDDSGAPYEICLDAEDTGGLANRFCFTIADINQRPVADAGADQSANEGDVVVLDGAGSLDPDGDPITLTWMQVSGEPVTLDTSDPVHPTFTAPSVGREGAILTFDLVADDGRLLSAPDFVNVTVTNVNQAPVADAGANQTVNELTPVALDASASFDPDGEAMTFNWSQTAGDPVVLMDADQPIASFTAPEVTSGPIVLEFTVVVDDGLDTDLATTLVTVENVNHQPVADAGDTQAVNEGDPVTLNGSGSSDPDGDALDYQWTQTSGTPVALDLTDPAHPAFIAPDVDGNETLAFELIVSDGLLSSDPSVATVLVSDRFAPPVCDLAEARIVDGDGELSRDNVMWPPNHTMREIAIIGVSDPLDLDVTITIDRVTQDEPLNGAGDGNTDEDAVVNVDGVLLLRAERAAGGDGRVYLIEFTATNALGEACSGSVEIVVPHDRRSTPVDSGQNYLSWEDS